LGSNIVPKLSVGYLSYNLYMKIIKEVSILEVKRAFVIANLLTQRKNRGNNQVFLKNISEKELEERLVTTKRKVLKLTSQNLDTLITPKWPRRVNSYNSSRWFIAQISTQDLGVWTRAGNLPLRWTNQSLFETAAKVKRALDKNSKQLKQRPRHAIPNILKMKKLVNQEEKYLYPIVFKTDTGTAGRKRLKTKTKGDIDDGCMRSIAMAISGEKAILIYFGIPKTPKALK
jgi:hypothetical protein